MMQNFIFSSLIICKNIVDAESMKLIPTFLFLTSSGPLILYKKCGNVMALNFKII